MVIWGPLLVNEEPHSTVAVTHEILRSVDPLPEAGEGGVGGGGWGGWGGRGGGGGGGGGWERVGGGGGGSLPPLSPLRVYKQQKSL